MDGKRAYCSPDVNPEAAGECRGAAMPEDVREEIVAEKPDLEDVGMEDAPLGEEGQSSGA